MNHDRTEAEARLAEAVAVIMRRILDACPPGTLGWRLTHPDDE